MKSVQPSSVLRWINPALQGRSRDTLERILDAAERLLSKRLFRDISVADIAKAAHASPTSLYARFESKQALLGAIFQRYAASQRESIDQLLAVGQWRHVPLASALRQTLPVVLGIYRAKQGLIRAFLEQAAEDARFRQAWAEVGEFIRERVTRLVMDHVSEVGHPQPEQGVRLALETLFATIALRIVMHDFNAPQVDALTDDLSGMMLRHMGIAEVSAAAG